MAHFDTAAIRKAATDIRSEIGKYKTASDSINTTITGMKQYWDDAVNQNYVKRYNKDLKPTAEDVMKLMEAYAKFLDAAADAYDKIITTGNAGING